MEVFVHRQPKGFITKDLEDIEELAEQLGNYGLLTPDEEVTIEITAKWSEIRDILSQPAFANIWFNPKTDPRFKE